MGCPGWTLRTGRLSHLHLSGISTRDGIRLVLGGGGFGGTENFISQVFPCFFFPLALRVHGNGSRLDKDRSIHNIPKGAKSKPVTGKAEEQR
jgi:hypothetical protein